MDQKLFSILEIYRITFKAFLMMRKFRKARKEDRVSKELMERIMLCVTEVNECPVCSYGHSKIALEMGMSALEIQEILAGQHAQVPLEELPALMFAQHYAESRGKYSEKSYQELSKIYGQDKAEAIMATTSMIMMGNAYGIPWASFIRRFTGQADPRCFLTYELSVVISSFIMIPLAFFHSLITKLFRRFKKKNPNKL